MIRETDIENYLCGETARRLGGMAYKTVSPGRVGFPDRLLCWRGRRRKKQNCLVELKRPGEKPTRRQLIEHDRLRELGQDVFAIETKAEVDALMNELETW